ncbi:prolyl oligopeptidase family serine peptidase [Thalassotalea fonticola]|uniref:Prolyl oligopeptidase family serine peptidase n=1 Tax=Thalassotalea fonticola TaxID=3065649 RepID=A0ABZ0GNL3_9GAMM|nr:prolyl oligopeptidase family serine peptidase [Colwelliaceae bacterium S1-1]
MKQIILILISILVINGASAQKLIPVEDIFRNQAVNDMKLSPNGRYIFSHEYVSQRNIYILAIIDPIAEKKYPIFRIDNVRHSRVKKFSWVDNDTLFIEIGKRKGFIELDFNGENPIGNFELITAKGYVIATLPEQEDTVVFVHDEGRRKPKHYVYKINKQQLADRDFDNAKLIDDDRSDALFFHYDHHNNALMAATGDTDELQFWYKELNKKWHKYWETDLKIEFTPVGFMNDDTLAVLSNKDLGTVSLVAFDIKSQQLGDVIYKHPMYDLVDVELNPKGQGVHSVSYLEHGMQVTKYFSAKNARFKKKLNKSFANQQSSVLDSSLDKNFHIIGTYSATNAGFFYYLDQQKELAIEIGPQFPSLSEYTLSETKTFDIEVEPGVTVEAILTTPSDYNNNTLLVYPHGGPVGIRDDAGFNRDTQYLANRGYSILQVNFRGSAGFGTQFKDAGRGQFGQLIEHDITAAVNHVRKNYQYDHMCSIGASYGGYSAVMLAIKHPEQYECVVSMYGIYDLLHLFNASNYKTQDEFREKVSAVVGEFNDNLIEVSPFYFAEKIKSPILLIAGKKDKIADFEQANRMKYRLQQLDKDIETVFYNKVGHGHYSWYGDRHQFAYIDDFIRRKLNLDAPQGSNDTIINSQERSRLMEGYNLDKDSNPYRKMIEQQESDIDAQIRALEEQERLEEELEKQAHKEIEETLNR